jgi:hypothetical protein
MPITLPIHGAVYLQDTSRTGTTTAQSAPVDGFLSEHNRGAANISTEIIDNRKRTVSGTLRSYFVATKKTFSFSWENLPADYAHTVDGQLVPTSNVIIGMGGNDFLNFYESYYNKAFYLYIINRNATRTSGITQANINTDLAAANTAGERYLVMFKDFQYEIVKRNVKMVSTAAATDFWNVDASFEEV